MLRVSITIVTKTRFKLIGGRIISAAAEAATEATPSTTLEIDDHRDIATVAVCVDSAEVPVPLSRPVNLQFADLHGAEILNVIPRLLNPGNACYQNALVCSLFAVYLQTGICFGQISELLGSSRSMELVSHSGFATLLHGWAEPERQHDIAEFAQHLLSKMGGVVAGWEFRQDIAGHVQAVYRGMLAQPVVLPLPSVHASAVPTLQSLIDTWQSEMEGYAGLTHGERLVLLQLDRFTFVGGAVVKNMVEVSIPSSRIVSLPCFEQPASLSIVHVRYRVLAMMLHLGTHIHNGHYVTIWWRGDMMIHSDDDVSEPLQSLTRHHRCNAYVLLAVRC